MAANSHPKNYATANGSARTEFAGSARVVDCFGPIAPPVLVAPSVRVWCFNESQTQLPSTYALGILLTPQEHYGGYRVLVATTQHPKGLPNEARANRQTRYARLLGSMGVGGCLVTETRWWMSDEHDDHLHGHWILKVPPCVSDEDLQSGDQTVSGYKFDGRIEASAEDFRPFQVQHCYDAVGWLEYAAKHDRDGTDPVTQVWGSLAVRLGLPGLEPQAWGDGPEQDFRCGWCDEILPGDATCRRGFCNASCRGKNHRRAAAEDVSAPGAPFPG